MFLKDLPKLQIQFWPVKIQAEGSAAIAVVRRPARFLLYAAGSAVLIAAVLAPLVFVPSLGARVLATLSYLSGFYGL